jgi:hypothetical protein
VCVCVCVLYVNINMCMYHIILQKLNILNIYIYIYIYNINIYFRLCLDRFWVESMLYLLFIEFKKYSFIINNNIEMFFLHVLASNKKNNFYVSFFLF